MCSGTISYCSASSKRNNKHNRRITKQRKAQQKSVKIKFHRSHGPSNKNNNNSHQHGSFSPIYQVSEPVVLKPLSFSDEHKPELATSEDQETKQVYSCYIDGLVILKMQQEERKNRLLIQEMNRINFQ